MVERRGRGTFGAGTAYFGQGPYVTAIKPRDIGKGGDVNKDYP
jgi:hypothetical protein